MYEIPDDQINNPGCTREGFDIDFNISAIDD